MLNLNSPTVQAMLANTPQGYGNMPVYYGNSPTVSQVVQPITNQQPSFPSPKEMLTQGGQQMVYAPTTFAPTNIIGGYNPGYNAAFAGYTNPYMGYGIYGYNPMMPIDEDSRERLEAAISNGLTYDEQLVQESNLYKTLSRIVSKNVGRSEEEADKCASFFNIYCKYPAQVQQTRKSVEPMHIRLKVGDNVVADMDPTNSTTIIPQNYSRNASYVEYMKQRADIAEEERIRRNNMYYYNAPERQFDKMDLLDFFNKGAGVLMADSEARILYAQSIGRTTQIYDQDGFRERLLKNNGLKSKSQLSAIERFTGRYGVMPDGRPVSPGHDPSVASSFSYNPKTGQYEVTAPNFLRDRLEASRQAFIKSIDE